MSIFRPALGDVVYLLNECRSERSGLLYEIGTTARVIGARSELLTLETGDPAHRDVLVCHPDHVTQARRARQPAPWYRRRTASRAWSGITPPVPR